VGYPRLRLPAVGWKLSARSSFFTNHESPITSHACRSPLLFRRVHRVQQSVHSCLRAMRRAFFRLRVVHQKHRGWVSPASISIPIDSGLSTVGWRLSAPPSSFTRGCGHPEEANRLTLREERTKIWRSAYRPAVNPRMVPEESQT